MRLLILSIVLLLFSTQRIKAQEYEFEQFVYDNVDYGTHIAAAVFCHEDDREGKYLVGGFNNRLGDSGVLMKISSGSNVVQSRFWPDPTNHIRDIKVIDSGGYLVSVEHTLYRLGNDINETIWSVDLSSIILPTGVSIIEISSILISEDNEIYVGCATTNGSQFFGSVVKYDMSGNLDPNFYSNGYLDLDPNREGAHYVNSLTSMEDGNVIAVLGGVPGAINHFPTQRYYTNHPFTIVKFDGTTPIDSRIFSLGQSNEIFNGGGSYSIKGKDGNYYFTGITNERKCFVLKTNNLLEKQYLKIHNLGIPYGSNYESFGIGLHQKDSGSIVLAAVHPPNYEYNFTLKVLDSYGNISEHIGDMPSVGTNDEGSC